MTTNTVKYRVVVSALFSGFILGNASAIAGEPLAANAITAIYQAAHTTQAPRSKRMPFPAQVAPSLHQQNLDVWRDPSALTQDLSDRIATEKPHRGESVALQAIQEIFAAHSSD